MRPRYSFSSRHTGRARDPSNYKRQKERYPELLRKVIDQSQIILEVIDARFMNETRNREIEKDLKKMRKEVIYVINKVDLNSKLPKLPGKYSIVSCRSGKGIKNLRDKIQSLSTGVKKNKEGKTVVGVIGYPNTGKSSLINSLTKRGSAGTGADAGFTKGIQKLRLSKDIVLLDSPGVIPKSEYSTTNIEILGKNAKVGARSYSQIKNPEHVITELIREFPGVLEKYYKLKAKDDSELLLDLLGKKKNFFIKGGKVDTDKTARLIIKDWQEGRIKIE